VFNIAPRNLLHLQSFYPVFILKIRKISLALLPLPVTLKQWNGEWNLMDFLQNGKLCQELYKREILGNTRKLLPYLKSRVQ
jgi:hypothetical protein